jgi:hypothetical protein
MVDGKLTKNTPEDEKWGGLMKGGTAGIYTVVVALSWWVKALGKSAEGGDVSTVVQDVTWVLNQVRGTLLTERGSPSQGGSPGLKRAPDDLNDENRKKKR